MNIFNFTVEGEPFQFDSGFFDQEAFVVHSVPRDYTVSWKAENSPLLLIENILNQNPKNLLLIDKNVWDLYFLKISIILTYLKVFLNFGEGGI